MKLTCDELLDIWSREGKTAVTKTITLLPNIRHPRTAWCTFQRQCLYPYSQQILGRLPLTSKDYQILQKKFKRDRERTPIV